MLPEGNEGDAGDNCRDACTTCFNATYYRVKWDILMRRSEGRYISWLIQESGDPVLSGIKAAPCP